MTWNVWVFFAVTEAVLCLTPGPAVLFVISHGVARGGRASLWANLGILTGNTLYFVLSAMGLGAVLLASHTVFTILKYAGAGYLIVLGVQTIRGSGLSLRTDTAGDPGSAGWRSWARAFGLQAANPKALVFFVALLPQFIDPSKPIVLQMVILCITSVVIEFVVLAGYGYLAARAAALARQERFVTITNRVNGGLLIAAGAAVALNRRP